ATLARARTARHNAPMPPILFWELVLRGAAVGALAAVGAALWKAGRQPFRIVGPLFTLSTIAYIFNGGPFFWAALGWLVFPGARLSLGGVGYFWLFVVTLFEDRKLTLANFTPVILLTLVGIIGWIGHRPSGDTLWIVHNLIEACFGVHALAIIIQSW